MNKLRKTILAALLLAAEIVLNRFLSIRTPIVTIGFSFIPMILTAMLLGPVYCVVNSVLADLIGALLFPSGAFFPGYTFTALMMGLIHGLLLNKSYKKSIKQFTLRVIISCVLVSLICSAGLNTLWVWVTTKKAAFAIIPTRLLKELIMLPLKVIIMVGLHTSFLKLKVYDKLIKPNEDTEQLDDTQTAEDMEPEKLAANEPNIKGEADDNND